MSPPLDLTNTQRFPSLADLPLVNDEGGGGNREEWWLIGQIKERMTITQPTVVATDRSGADFAATFDKDDAGADERVWKKGHCLAIPRARRTASKAGGGFVKVPPGQGGSVRVVPGGWEVLRAMERVQDGCASCEGEGGSRCLGCGVVRYCSKVSRLPPPPPPKPTYLLGRALADGTVNGNLGARQECQVKGWTEGGHKKECKAFKAATQIWGDDKQRGDDAAH
ncbi:hypothetical protein S7711_10341 [Stachybotrys chartarum IBT 7711]|uniref:Uncharacterized protein n=1 Tax=Stachybotrys chartarum (strain CBS 109288 / IBT 7711) TaxID=1280523 RepID=A0A084B3M1_STACB|nr:hypothetical protein S7711_10341 [Stachybotrys chartarum IBT 7711]